MEDSNLMQPKQYTAELNELEGGFNVLLDDFKKLFVITNMHPSNQEYKNQYDVVLDGFSKISSRLFSISNNVNFNIDDINKEIVELDKLIREERNKNKKLKLKLGIVENENNASSEMINDYKDIYDKRYLRNWSLVLASILCLSTISIVFKKKIQV